MLWGLSSGQRALALRALVSLLLWSPLVWLGVSAPAEAQRSDAARAREHFESGTRAFEEGDYALAIQEFRASYEITEHADLLFNIYSAAERAGLLEDAESALARYLEEGRPGRQRRSLEARLTRLRARIEETRAEEARAEAARAEAARAEEARAAEAAREAALAAEAASLAEPDGPPADVVASPSPPPSGGVHPAGIATLVGAGVLFASFGVFAALSELEDQALASRCGRDVGAICPPRDVQTLDTYSLIADVSWIAGATAAAVGLVLLLALPPETSASGESVAFVPWVTLEGAGAGAVGRW